VAPEPGSALLYDTAVTGCWIMGGRPMVDFKAIRLLIRLNRSVRAPLLSPATGGRAANAPDHRDGHL